MVHRIAFLDGERELTAFDWEFGLAAAIEYSPQFLANFGATSEHIWDDKGVEVWSLSVPDEPH